MKYSILNIIFSLILIIQYSVNSDEEEDSDVIIKNVCRERNRLVGANKTELFEVTTAFENSTVILECHYCNETDDRKSKIWYRRDRLISSNISEVNIDMETNLTLNRVYVTLTHSLVIKRISLEDSGVYLCHGRNGDDVEDKYNYFLDVIYQNKSNYVLGNISNWKIYYEEFLEPLNIRFINSMEKEFRIIRSAEVKVEAITEWKSWEKCVLCGRKAGDGQRRRTGACRLKILPRQKTGNHSSSVHVIETEQIKFIKNSVIFPCRSVYFSKIYPAISNITRWIPLFIEVEHCDGVCNPDADGKGKGFNVGSKKGFKYKKIYVLAQKAHLTLICPESSLDTKVTWKRNGRELKSGVVVKTKDGSEPHIRVDTFNTLYLVEVTDDEEGNYTCSVDGKNMQQVRIFVRSKNVLLTQAFMRHMAYLGFILFLTSFCYCAGLFIACKRRFKFKRYTEIIQEENLL